MKEAIKNNRNKHILVLALMLLTATSAMACTSMLVSAKASATGRPLMWKHRDTGTEHNFIERVPAKNGNHAYVALYNGGDTDLSEAWMGMNDAGFAIMNTASYNLMPDTAKYKDQEGVVMAKALKKCCTIEDFTVLLDTMPKPMGVQANFGVMDATGAMAYFETDDYQYTRYDMDDEVGYIIRTNHSLSGNDNDGYGYIRFQNTQDILADEIAAKCFSPESFTEKCSRSFWHSLHQKDFGAGTDRWVVDQDFIPRNISSASIVIEGATNESEIPGMVMWTMIGYPPCSVVKPVTINKVPDELRPISEGFRSPYCNEVLMRKSKAFPMKVGNGQKYIDMAYLRPIIEACREQSMYNYKKYRNK